MAYQSCQQDNSPHTIICTLTVHAQQTSILRQQGCTCTPRQAFIANLSTFIKDTKRGNHHILSRTAQIKFMIYNVSSKLHKIDQHQPFPP